MRVLVSAASKHAGTAEIARRIADVLRADNLEVAVIPANEVVGQSGPPRPIRTAYRWTRPSSSRNWAPSSTGCSAGGSSAGDSA
jgi:hypothetical protein